MSSIFPFLLNVGSIIHVKKLRKMYFSCLVIPFVSPVVFTLCSRRKGTRMGPFPLPTFHTKQMTRFQSNVENLKILHPIITEGNNKPKSDLNGYHGKILLQAVTVCCQQEAENKLDPHFFLVLTHMTWCLCSHFGSVGLIVSSWRASVETPSEPSGVFSWETDFRS